MPSIILYVLCVCPLDVGIVYVVSEGRMLPREALRRSGPELVSGSLKTES